MKWLGAFVFIAGTACSAQAQWDLQQSHVDASLRGISAVSESVAWASGSKGTVLKTLDGGSNWTRCAMPEEAAELDFRAIQAFDTRTAWVMSSGKGDLSRVYKTLDGCATWTLERTNKDESGFWDALVFLGKDAAGRNLAELLGDPVEGHFVIYSVLNGRWREEHGDPFAPEAHAGEAAFAASNQSVLLFDQRDYMIGTGGTRGSRVIYFKREAMTGGGDVTVSKQKSADVPMATGAESAGIFALGKRDRERLVAVGGDYAKPDATAGTAAFSLNGGESWTAAAKLPGGYRSSVAYDAKHDCWVTVGTNGTDISTDNGKDWKPLKGKAGEDGGWNAVSLPFAVGAKGKIGRLKVGALPEKQVD